MIHHHKWTRNVTPRCHVASSPGDADLVPVVPRPQEMREFVDPEGQRYRTVREAEMKEPPGRDPCGMKSDTGYHGYIALPIFIYIYIYICIYKYIYIS